MALPALLALLSALAPLQGPVADGAGVVEDSTPSCVGSIASYPNAPAVYQIVPDGSVPAGIASAAASAWDSSSCNPGGTAFPTFTTTPHGGSSADSAPLHHRGQPRQPACLRSVQRQHGSDQPLFTSPDAQWRRGPLRHHQHRDPEPRARAWPPARSRRSEQHHLPRLHHVAGGVSTSDRRDASAAAAEVHPARGVPAGEHPQHHPRRTAGSATTPRAVPWELCQRLRGQQRLCVPLGVSDHL